MTMTSKRKYADDHREEEGAEQSTVRLKMSRMSDADNDDDESSSSTNDFSLEEEVSSEEETI
jgi:hypothetical protein